MSLGEEYRRTNALFLFILLLLVITGKGKMEFRHYQYKGRKLMLILKNRGSIVQLAFE